MNKEEMMQQLAEAYASIQQVEIKATVENIAAIDKTLGLLRYVFNALEGTAEEAGNVSD